MCDRDNRMDRMTTIPRGSKRNEKKKNSTEPHDDVTPEKCRPPNHLTQLGEHHHKQLYFQLKFNSKTVLRDAVCVCHPLGNGAHPTIAYDATIEHSQIILKPKRIQSTDDDDDDNDNNDDGN